MKGGWFFMFKPRLFLIIILFFFLISGFSCAKEKINIQGSTTVLPIIQIMAEEFMNDYPEYEVTIVVEDREWELQLSSIKLLILLCPLVK
jgi:ABC-type phosphate transport system substrate-binding protein